jgi:hypothetical protein
MKPLWIVVGALTVSTSALAQFHAPHAVPSQSGTRASASHSLLTPFRPAKNSLPGGVGPQATSQQGLALASTGSDDCSTADAITGVGSFAFDNSFATTGLNGQNNSPDCTFFGQTSVTNDVWFSWTAPATGLVVLSFCGQTTVDTKVAVYDLAAIGGVCPANAAASTVVACNDDLSFLVYQSRVTFNATASLVYLIQIGTYPIGPAPGGPGNFSLEYDPIADATPCQVDDGSGDAVETFDLTPNSELAVFQRFGRPGDNTLVSNLFVAYGALFANGQTGTVDGMPVNVFIYDDPNDDYDPSDAVLLQSVATTIQQHDTDLFNTVPLSPAIAVSGVYFIGWSFTNPAVLPALPLYPFGSDAENCEALPGDAWVAFNVGGPMDFNDLSATGGNSQPIDVYFYDDQPNLAWLIRPDCMPLSAGSAFCFSDGSFTDHTTACPCGNFGTAGNGCAHSFSATGANMSATGSTLNDDVVLHSQFEPVSSFTLMMQHANTGDTVFHDGVLCAANPLIRLRGRSAVAGEAFFPNSNFAQDSTTTLSIRGGVTVGSGALRFYAAWYRNASSTFCPPATANVTNGWQITW